jgi:hypothetical protein
MPTAPQQVAPKVNHITRQIIAAAMKGHSALGPGLLESGRQVGLLINFHVVHLRDGIKRMVDGYDWRKPLTTESTEFHRGKTTEIA